MTAAQHWLLLILTLLATTIQPTRAAYIQSVSCLSTHFQPRIQHELADQVSLRVRLEHLNETHDRLTLNVIPPYKLPGKDDIGCDSWYPKFGIGSVALELSTLGCDDSVSYFAVDQNCKDNKWEGEPKQLELESDYPTIPQLSTFQIALYFLLDGDDNNGASHNTRDSPSRVGAVENAERQRVGACIRSAATARPSNWLTMTLRYIPVAILALVVVAGVVRSLPSTSATLMASAANSSSTPGRRNNRTPPRPILPNVGDCLQYLQFIFLTACLSLRYPGFYQPAVGELRWYSLFGMTLWTGYYGGGQSYDGFVDGIYELNGTFGGTYGAELMTQVVGAPLTMGTWINMVVCVAIAAVAVAVLLWALWMLEARQTLRLGLPALGGTGTGTGNGNGNGSAVFPKPGPLANNVAKVILSYFMLPVVALSAYQLDYANQLPITHSTFAVAMLAVLFTAFVWLVWRMPTRSLGVLLFDSSKRYRRLGGGDGPGGGVLDDDDDDDDHDNHHNHNNSNSNSAAASRSRSRDRSDKLFVYALFLTTFVRAALIGGVQVSGLAQVISLFCTEFIFAAYIVAMQAYPLISIGSLAAAVRVLTIAAMIAFVPDMVSETPREVLGYAVLAMHALFLFCGFGIGAVWHLGNAVAQRVAARKDVEVYGLRDLNRRPDSRNDLAFRSDMDVHSSFSPSPQSPSNYRRSQLRDRPPGRDAHSPHPGTRLDIPSLYSGDSGRYSPASLASYPQSPVSPVGTRMSFPGPRRHPPTSVPRSVTPNTLTDSRLNSLRSSEPRSSSSGASRSSGSSGSARDSGHGSGSGSGGGGYYFRPPRSSTYAPSLTESTITSGVRGAGSGGGSRLQSAIFTREPVLSPGDASRPQSVVAVHSPGAHDGKEDGIRGAKHVKKTIRMVPAEDEEGVDGTMNTQVTRAQKAHDVQTQPLGPRWNDYSFREADLIYGGPDEGEFEAARAHYGLPTHATDEDVAAGRASITTTATMSTLSHGSKMSQDAIRNDDADADDDDDGADRSSDFTTRVKNKKDKKAAAAAAAAKGLAKGKLYQLRQLSSQSRLSLLSASSSAGKGGTGGEGELSSTGDGEQGFSVRRPRPPEHVLRQMAAAARAQQLQAQDSQINDLRGSSSLDSVRERKDEGDHDATAATTAAQLSKYMRDEDQ